MVDTKDRVLDAAERLFFSRGIAVTGIDEVASEAGVAIATLYKHAGSKDNLLREVLQRRLDAWIEHWDAAVASATTPTDRVLAVFDAIETFRAAAGPAQWCAFLATSSERPRPADPTSDPVFDPIRRDDEILRERLTDYVGALDLTDELATVDALLLLYNGVLGSLLRGAPIEPAQRARAVAAQLIG